MLVTGLARADVLNVATERPGSLLMFPKVVNANGRNTIIQITNTGNSVNNLHCYYLDGQAGTNGDPICRETDFLVTLTKQQPTHWVVGTGRPLNPGDAITGLDPGLIPPVAPGFTGALVCAEVGDDDVPVAQNKLKGEATLEGPGTDVSKYSAIAIQGHPPVGTDSTLSLNNTEYDACSSAGQFNFIPEGATDPVIEALGNAGTCTGGPNAGLGCNANSVPGDCPDPLGGFFTCTTGGSSVTNTITILPCNLDFQTQVATRFRLNYLVTDEDETQYSFSDSATRSCWASINLADLPDALANPAGPLLGPYATIRVSSASGGPFLFVAETFRADATGNVAAAAVNVHTEGLCRGTSAPALSCQSDADCLGVGSSICDLTAPATVKLQRLP